MCIYFIQAEQGGLIKIGASSDPVTRLYNLQMFCPVPLKILATIKDAPQSKEGWVHSQLREWRQYGEWFKPSIGVLLFMQQNAVEFEPAPARRFEEEDTVMIGTKTFKRCKGYSITTHARCKNSASWIGIKDYCSRHQP